MPTCPSCTGDAPEGARFCPRCGAPLGGRAGGPLRRILTLMFVDLVGSTKLAAENELERYDDILATYHGVASRTVHEFGGSILQLYGDGVLACFGLTDDAENAALSALLAARAVALAMPEAEPGMAVRVGIHSGTVMCRVEAGGEVLPQITGLDVNVASRIEGQAAPGGVVVSAATLDFVSRIARVEAHDLGPVKLKGVDAPMRLFEIGEAPPGPPQLAPEPLVEREQVVQALIASEPKGAHVSVLVGHPGIGKSALLAEVARRLDNACLRVDLAARLNLRHTPLHPVAEWLAHALGFPRFPLDPAVRREDVAGRLRALLPGTDDARVDVVGDLLGLADAATLQSRYAPPQLREMRIATLVEIVVELMEAGPTLLLVDDFHWVDEDTHAVLDRLLARGAPEGTRVILSSRPDGGLTEFAARHGLKVIRLEPLSAEGARALIGRTGPRSLAAEAAERVLVLAEGNPLFLRSLLDLLRRGGDPGGGAGGLPPTIAATFQGLVNSFGAARETALQAAVIGRGFTLEELSWLAGPDEDTGARITELAAAGLVERAAGGVCQFSHVLLQEAAYDMIPASRRREMHRRFAEALRANDPTRAAAVPEVAADHFIAAGDPTGIAGSAVEAGIGFLRRAGFERAVHYLRHAVDALDALGAAQGAEALRAPRLGALTLLAAAKMQRFGFSHPDTLESYRALETAAHEAGGRGPERVQAHYGLFAHRIISGEVRASRHIVAEMVEAADPADPGQILLGEVNACALALYSGRLDDCLAASARAKALYDPAAHGLLFLSVGADPLISVLTAEANVVALRGGLDAARDLTGEATAHADALGAALQIPWIKNFNGSALLMAGAIAEGEAMIDEGLELAREQGAAFWSLVGLMWKAVAASDRGAPETAPMPLPEVMARAAGIGVGLNRPLLRAVLATDLQRAGEAARAREAALSACRDAAVTGQGQWSAEIWRRAADVLAAQGDHEAAERRRIVARAYARRMGAVEAERRCGVEA